MNVVGKIKNEVCEATGVLRIERAVKKYFYEKYRQFDMNQHLSKKCRYDGPYR
jgi:hypothetical protein